MLNKVRKYYDSWVSFVQQRFLPNKKQANYIESKEMQTRMLAALELMDFGINLMRQNIARQLPKASKEFIDAEFRRWMMDQPRDFVPGKVSVEKQI